MNNIAEKYDKDAYQIAFRESLQDKLYNNKFDTNVQNIHTPFSLCAEQIRALEKETSLYDKDILTFNIEYIEVLIYDFGVSKERIWFATDCKQKIAILEHSRYKGVNSELVEFNKQGIKDMSNKIKKQFDVVVGNPPYQGNSKTKREKEGYEGSSDSRNNLLWPLFVTKSLELCKEKGYVCLIHPPKWRKPEDKLWGILKKYQIEYLEIHNKKDGNSVFGVTTRYDWYILQKTALHKKTIIKDENGDISNQDLRKWDFLPNYLFDNFCKILKLDKSPSLEVLYSAKYHHQNKKIMKNNSDKKFKFPCVHSIRCENDTTFWYSNNNNNGIFGIKKVILNDGETLYPIIDLKGEYGTTEGPFSIRVSNKQEANNIVNAINSDKFKEIVKASKWSSYRTDYRMFKYFRKDFWKEFI